MFACDVTLAKTPRYLSDESFLADVISFNLFWLTNEIVDEGWNVVECCCNILYTVNVSAFCYFVIYQIISFGIVHLHIYACTSEGLPFLKIINTSNKRELLIKLLGLKS